MRHRSRPTRIAFWARFLPLALITVLPIVLSSHSVATESPPPVQVVTLNQQQVQQLKRSSPLLSSLVPAAAPSIGTPYKWGGSSLKRGIDCSNYTWQLFRKAGLPYERYLGTQFMSRIHQNGALRKVNFQMAQAGDLLVYGYSTNRQWYGHVVILIDKDGEKTGKKGLTLGAHGGEIGTVQYITYRGFESGYFKHPRMKLVNVLRITPSDGRDSHRKE